MQFNFGEDIGKPCPSSSPDGNKKTGCDPVHLAL